MKKIWKYVMSEVSLEQPNSFSMPGFQEVIACGLDSNNNVAIWCIIDNEKAYENINIWCIGTDWNIEEINTKNCLESIGSVNQFGFMWHLFLEK